MARQIKHDDLTEFGLAVVKVCEARGWSLSNLSYYAKVPGSPRRIYRLIRTHGIPAKDLHRICKVLNLSPGRFADERILRRHEKEAS